MAFSDWVDRQIDNAKMNVVIGVAFMASMFLAADMSAQSVKAKPQPTGGGKGHKTEHVKPIKLDKIQSGPEHYAGHLHDQQIAAIGKKMQAFGAKITDHSGGGDDPDKEIGDAFTRSALASTLQAIQGNTKHDKQVTTRMLEHMNTKDADAYAFMQKSHQQYKSNGGKKDLAGYAQEVASHFDGVHLKAAFDATQPLTQEQKVERAQTKAKEVVKKTEEITKKVESVTKHLDNPNLDEAVGGAKKVVNIARGLGF